MAIWLTQDRATRLFNVINSDLSSSCLREVRNTARNGNGEIAGYLAAGACRSVVLDGQADELAHLVPVEQQQHVATSGRLL